MFKVGDIVVCIKDQYDGFNYFLTIGKKYTVIHKGYFSANYIQVKDNFNIPENCNPCIFVSEVEYRRLKLEKICSKLVTG